MNNSKPIYVTQPSVAPISDVAELLKTPWESGIMTHNGPLLQRLEREIKEKMRLRNIAIVINGTLALELPIRAMRLRGEIITTPFSWIATSSAILWQHCTPVFVDVDPHTFNLDPNKIKDAITHKTVGIMPVHVFSNPCDCAAIDSIAAQHNLRVIYDAAHAMCVDHKGKSVMEWGDVSATSFHATKLFNTGEGGACIAPNDELHEMLKSARFFGHDAQKQIKFDGTNAKMTEIHAAVGLANWPHVDAVIARRRAIYTLYRKHLGDIEQITWQQFDEAEYNYSYMPIVFQNEEQLLVVLEALKAENIFPRRYFYPSLNTLQVLGQYTPMPISEGLAQRIICLPSYTNLTDEQVVRISTLIRAAL